MTKMLDAFMCRPSQHCTSKTGSSTRTSKSKIIGIIRLRSSTLKGNSVAVMATCPVNLSQTWSPTSFRVINKWHMITPKLNIFKCTHLSEISLGQGDEIELTVKLLRVCSVATPESDAIVR